MSRAAAVTASAPPSIGNCAAGFDVLGHSLRGPVDRVTCTRTDRAGVEVVAVHGCEKPLPLEAERNTAGRAVLELLRLACATDLGLSLEVHKGIPLASGMGGSAASSVAAVVAANELLDARQPTDLLYRAACAGEAAASGAPHGDNVAPSLLGGLVIAPREGAPVQLDVPEWLHIALVHPHCELETRTSRAVLQDPFELAEVTAQTEALALMLAGCARGDEALLRRGVRDVLVEPRRAPLIPGFAQVKHAALAAGAVGASIAGGGPSVFGWFASQDAAAAGGASMQRAFEQAGLKSDLFVSPVRGPRAEVESCR